MGLYLVRTELAGSTIAAATRRVAEEQGICYRRSGYREDQPVRTELENAGAWETVLADPDHPPDIQHRYVVERIKGLGGILILDESLALFPWEMPEQRARKKVQVIPLPRSYQKQPISIERAIEAGMTPQMLMEARFRGLSIENCYMGYDWKGLSGTSGGYRVTTLVDCLMGALCFANNEGTVVDRLYLGGEGALLKGGIASFVVPSLSVEGEQHRFLHHHIPLLDMTVPEQERAKNHHAVWFDYETTNRSPKKEWAEVSQSRMLGELSSEQRSRKRTGDEMVFDFHDWWAALDLKQFTYGMDRRTTHLPLIIPTEGLYGYYHHLLHDVFYQKNGNIRQLSQPMMETLLWKYVASLEPGEQFMGNGSFRQFMKLEPSSSPSEERG